MNENEIYLVLKTYSEKPIKNIEAYKKTDSIGWKDFRIITDFIRDREYIIEKSGKYHIQKIGELYLLELKKEIEQTEKDKIAERKKLRNESVLSEWKKNTFWFVFIFGLLGGFYSAYDFFIKAPSIEKEFQQIKSDILKNKDTIKELRTLVLTQKKGDSLNHSNSELNK
jgi:hypothetical protein